MRPRRRAAGVVPTSPDVPPSCRSTRAHAIRSISLFLKPIGGMALRTCSSHRLRPEDVPQGTYVPKNRTYKQEGSFAQGNRGISSA